LGPAITLPISAGIHETAVNGQIFGSHAARCEALLERARTRCRGSVASWLTAPVALVSSSTMNPVSPCSTISSTEPRLNAITGVPHAIASIITKPNGSGQSIVTRRAIAPLRNSDF